MQEKKILNSYLLGVLVAVLLTATGVTMIGIMLNSFAVYIVAMPIKYAIMFTISIFMLIKFALAVRKFKQLKEFHNDSTLKQNKSSVFSLVIFAVYLVWNLCSCAICVMLMIKPTEIMGLNLLCDFVLIITYCNIVNRYNDDYPLITKALSALESMATVNVDSDTTSN